MRWGEFLAASLIGLALSSSAIAVGYLAGRESCRAHVASDSTPGIGHYDRDGVLYEFPRECGR